MPNPLHLLQSLSQQLSSTDASLNKPASNEGEAAAFPELLHKASSERKGNASKPERKSQSVATDEARSSDEPQPKKKPSDVAASLDLPLPLPTPEMNKALNAQESTQQGSFIEIATLEAPGEAGVVAANEGDAVQLKPSVTRDNAKEEAAQTGSPQAQSLAFSTLSPEAFMLMGLPMTLTNPALPPLVAKTTKNNAAEITAVKSSVQQKPSDNLLPVAQPLSGAQAGRLQFSLPITAQPFTQAQSGLKPEQAAGQPSIQLPKAEAQLTIEPLASDLSMDGAVSPLGSSAQKLGQPDASSIQGSTPLTEAKSDLGLSPAQDLLSPMQDKIQDKNQDNEGASPTLPPVVADIPLNSDGQGMNNAIADGLPKLESGASFSSYQGQDAQPVKSTLESVNNLATHLEALNGQINLQGAGSAGESSFSNDSTDDSEDEVKLKNISGNEGSSAGSLPGAINWADLNNMAPVGAGANNGSAPVLNAADQLTAPAGQALEQVAEGAIYSVKNGHKELILKLNPDQLGEVRISLQTRLADNALSARFVVSSPESLKTLQTQMDNLKAKLEDQGIRVDQFNIVLAGSGEAAFSGNVEQHRHDTASNQEFRQPAFQQQTNQHQQHAEQQSAFSAYQLFQSGSGYSGSRQGMNQSSSSNAYGGTATEAEVGALPSAEAAAPRNDQGSISLFA